MRANLWTEMGLVNGATGTLLDIVYDFEKGPSDMPVVLICEFDGYNGLSPEVGGKWVPIPVITRGWESTVPCSRTQFPVSIAYAMTVHKSQGLTLSKVIEI